MNIETSIKGIEKQRVDNHRERQPETEKYMYDGILNKIYITLFGAW
jgi:hypothetical protein